MRSRFDRESTPSQSCACLHLCLLQCDLMTSHKRTSSTPFPLPVLLLTPFLHRSIYSSKLSSETTSHTSAYTMPGTVIGNSTRIWELNSYWALYSQCGVWDSRGRGVDIWECIRDRKALSYCSQVHQLKKVIYRLFNFGH